MAAHVIAVSCATRKVRRRRSPSSAWREGRPGRGQRSLSPNTKRSLRCSVVEHRLADAELSWNLGFGMAAGHSVAVQVPAGAVTRSGWGAYLSTTLPTDNVLFPDLRPSTSAASSAKLTTANAASQAPPTRAIGTNGG